MGTAAFFTKQGEDPRPGKAVCAGCEVTAECLFTAHRTGAVGTWVGTSERERRQARKDAA